MSETVSRKLRDKTCRQMLGGEDLLPEAGVKWAVTVAPFWRRLLWRKGNTQPAQPRPGQEPRRRG